LSETGTTIEPTDRREHLRRYPRMFPQWALEASRPIVRNFCRLMWGLRWHERQHIPQQGGLIIAANHQTYIDPFWICSPIERPVRFLAWDAAFRWPVVGPIMRLLGAWPLQLEGSDPAPIRRSMQWLREGGAVVIFPEGGRGQADGTMRKLKPGAVRMALETGAVILPVTIRGGHRVWPTNRRWPRFARVEIIYHPPLVIEQRPGEDARSCARRETERLAEIIRSSL